jgi:hypothetical protein
MIQRCTNPKKKCFATYGGQGILVCDRWLSFDTFLADLGERPTGTTLGRFGDVGNYEPGNVAWQTWTEQAANRRPDRKYRRKNQQQQIAA